MSSTIPTDGLHIEHFVSPISFASPKHLVESAWTSHAPFGFWLVEALRPNVLVELGTHSGFSYFVFCQAVSALHLNTVTYAVDTWQGDEHSGRYGGEVFEAVNQVNEQAYAGFSTLYRSRFDDAVGMFQDRSIDLLHIDGRHFYEDAWHDFQTWRRKLSDQSVVLFHDTQVKDRGFGVWKLWAQLKDQFPSFEFLHGHGLGVLGTGGHLPENARLLFELKEAHRSVVQAIYCQLGTGLEAKWCLATQRLAMKTANRNPLRPHDVTQDSKSISSAALRTQPSRPRLHIHQVAMVPGFMDVRTNLPLEALGREPGIAVSSVEKAVSVPSLDSSQPKVLILQRLTVTGREQQWLEYVTRLIERNWIVITEIDDHPDLIAAVHNRSTKQGVSIPFRSVHAIQTSTEKLAAYFRTLNPNVAHFPNTVFDLPTYQSAPPNFLRIFYGAINRERFSAKVATAIQPIIRNYPQISVVVMHDRVFFEALGDVSKSFTPARPYKEYMSLMATCNIALLPLEGSSGEEFKSDLKYIEASSRGLASIASAAVYGDTIEHGMTGLIAPRVEDWPSCLDQMCEQPYLTDQLASRAWQYVKENRLFDSQKLMRLQWYEDLWARRRELNAELLNRIQTNGPNLDFSNGGNASGLRI